MTSLQKIFYYLIISTFICSGLINIFLYIIENKDIYLKEGSVLILIGIGILLSKNTSRIAAISLLISKSILFFSSIFFLILIYIIEIYLSNNKQHLLENNITEYNYWYILLWVMSILIFISGSRLLLDKRIIKNNNFDFKSKKEDYIYIIVGVLLFLATPASELVKIYKTVSTVFHENSRIIIETPDRDIKDKIRSSFEIVITKTGYVLVNKDSNSILDFGSNEIREIIRYIPKNTKKIDLKAHEDSDYKQTIKIIDAVGSIGITNFNLSTEPSSLENKQ